LNPLGRRILVLLAAPLLVLVTLSCGGGADRQTSKVFQAPPWTGPEDLGYNLSRRAEPSFGTCELLTEPNVEPGRTRLSHHCGNDSYSDDGVALVDAQSLQPLTATRTATDRAKDRKTVWTNTYEDSIVRFEADTNGSISKTTRDLPKPNAQSPDPGWYDDDTLLWLARGLPLKAGFEASYAHVINAGQPRVIVVDVKVDPAEKVTVPAGEFQSWKVRIVQGGSTYTIWVDEQAPNRVVKATIEDVTYELTAVR
jgi:hypothetical protein